MAKKIEKELEVAKFVNINADRVFERNEALRIKAERTDKYIKWMKNICMVLLMFNLVAIAIWVFFAYKLLMF